MQKLCLGLVILVATIALAADQPDANLQKKLEAMAAQHQGKVALFAKDMKTGKTIAIDADTPVQTASVIKLPLMLETMYEVKAGKHSLDEKITLTKDNQVPGSGVLQFMQPGLQLTLQDTLTLMIILSDNTATNLVIDDIGTTPVNARMEQMGLKDTYLYKKVYKPATSPMPPDQKKFGLGKTTAREMGEVLESIERCDLGDKSLCDKMIGIMKNQQDRNKIPRYLETVDTSETPSAIANKTGSLDAVRNDVGIVYTKHGPIVISAFTYDNKDQSWTPDNQAELLIAKMTKEVVDAWAEPSATANSPTR